jgi:hypothetical protein
VNAGQLWEEACNQRASETKGSTSNKGLKVELPNLVYTFVLHDCGVLCRENRKSRGLLNGHFLHA